MPWSGWRNVRASSRREELGTGNPFLVALAKAGAKPLQNRRRFAGTFLCAGYRPSLVWRSARNTRSREEGTGTTRAPIPSPRSLRGEDYFAALTRSEEHTSELQSLMRISYAVFCLKKK